jgi:hypothetical protein
MKIDNDRDSLSQIYFSSIFFCDSNGTRESLVHQIHSPSTFSALIVLLLHINDSSQVYAPGVCRVRSDVSCSEGIPILVNLHDTSFSDFVIKFDHDENYDSVAIDESKMSPLT